MKKLSPSGVAFALTMVVAPSANALDVEAYCGPDTALVGVLDSNVAVTLTNDDSELPDYQVESLKIQCLASVRTGPGKPDQVVFATIEIPDPGLGIIVAVCPLGSLPDGAMEWKASAFVSHGPPPRQSLTNCEEVPVM